MEWPRAYEGLEDYYGRCEAVKKLVRTKWCTASDPAKSPA